jgi:hypothetical protein
VPDAPEVPLRALVPLALLPLDPADAPAPPAPLPVLLFVSDCVSHPTRLIPPSARAADAKRIADLRIRMVDSSVVPGGRKRVLPVSRVPLPER